MSNDPISVAVVGTGNMGSNHVRVYDEFPEADLVEIVEPDEQRAAEITKGYDVTVRESVDDLRQAKAATVAVPNEHHRPVSEKLLEMGLDLLVEKPLATNVKEAEAIVEKAEERNAVLQVGHIEQYNPAVEMVSEILSSEELIAIDIKRLGPFNEHLTAESVIFDLMIHDIDIVDNLVPTPITYVDALGVTPRSELVDHAVANLKFEGEILGTLTASHVTHNKVRKLTATTKTSFIEMDYRNQTISVHRHGAEVTAPFDNRSGYRTESVVESPFVRTQEPLKNEIESFLQCVNTRETPKVDGQRGVRAIKIATDVLEAITTNGKS